MKKSSRYALEQPERTDFLGDNVRPQNRVGNRNTAGGVVMKRLLFNALLVITVLFIRLLKSPGIILWPMWALIVIGMVGLVYERPWDFNRWLALIFIGFPAPVFLWNFLAWALQKIKLSEAKPNLKTQPLPKRSRH